MRLGHDRHQLRLGAVRVLELIDQHVAEPRLDLGPCLGRLADEPQGERDLVAEVDAPARRQELLVAPVGCRELDLAPGALGEDGIAGCLRRGRREAVRPGSVLRRRHVLVLASAEQRREGAQESRRVAEGPVLVEIEGEEVLVEEDHRLGPAQDPDVRRHAEFERVLPDQAIAERMERADRRVRVAVRDELVDAELHLGGGLVGEGQGEDLRRLGPAGGDQPGDPPGDDLRLAGPGPGDHEQRALAVGHGPELLGV